MSNSGQGAIGHDAEAETSPASLHDIGLFGGLDDEAIAQLTASLELRVHGPGDVVFREGDAGRELFVVLSGEVEIVKHAPRGSDVRVALLGPRDWFGEMSLLDVQTRSATARTVAPSRLLVLTARDLDALYRRDLRAYALVVLNLAREMSRRLRVVDGIVADTIAGMLASRTRTRG